MAEVCGLRVADVDFMRGIVHPTVQYPPRCSRPRRPARRPPSRRRWRSHFGTRPGRFGPKTVLYPGQALYEVNEAAVVLRLSRRHLYDEIRSGRLRSVKSGRARRVPVSAIAEYVALLEQEAQAA
jgi:excisionase family DNA binding protein